MVEFYRSSDRAASRESMSGFANVVGSRLANDAMSVSRDAIASKPSRDRIVDFWTMNDSIDIENTIRENGLREITVIADLVRLNNQRERDIAALRSEVVDLRAAQQLADPTGAHPYRSTMPARPASSPVAASSAPERVEGRPGVLRRVYVALERLIVPGALGIGMLAQAGASALTGAPTQAIAWAMLSGIPLAVFVAEFGREPVR